MRIKWIILALVTFILGLAPASGRAQAELSLSSLEVDLWPEYDRPEMLVIYKLVLSSDVSLPAEVSLRIPTRAGEPNAVAERQVSGSLFTVAYERQVQGEWALITFTATMPESQVEYYDPSLEKNGSQRHFEYEWPGDYAVGSLTVEVQQPAGAQDLRTSPGLGAGGQRTDGLNYYSAPLGPLTAGQTFQLSLDYRKDSDALSVELQGLPVQPSAPITGETPGRVSVETMLPWLLGGLGVLLIASGVWWYWQLGQKKEAVAASPRRRRRAMTAEMAEVEEDGVYCHQCGKRAGAGDRFCRACGTRLRA